MRSRRVVITGVGPVTAFGLGIDPLWRALLEGSCAIAPIRRFDATAFPCQFGAEIPDEVFNIRDLVPRSYRKATKVMARDIEIAVGAALAAVQDAGVTTKGTNPEVEPTINPDRFGCHIGAGLIAADIDELTHAFAASRDERGEFDLKRWGTSGMQNLTPLWLLKYLPNMLACHVTIIHDCRGPSNTITCSEASGPLSLGESLRVIQRGQADACLTGGAEYKLNPMGILRQYFAHRLAETDPDEDPTTVVRPFDSGARGSILGEGGGILVLEEESIALNRGATPYAEVAGFASTQSFCSDTVGVEIDPEDDGIADAIGASIDAAELTADDIDAIVPFGSGIRLCDRAEAIAIRRVFGDRAAEVPVITTVPNLGNCCAGAGAINLCIGAKMLLEQMLPARLLRPAPAGGGTPVEGEPLPLDAGPAESRPADLRHVLIFTTSMGGQNAAVVLKRAT